MLLEMTVIMFSAIFSFIITYFIYKRFAVAVWGYIGAFLPRIPVTLVALAGGTNLLVFAWVSHVLGILLYPMLLAVADILLLEIALIRVARPVAFMLPKGLQTAIKIESFIDRMQDYHAVPRPVRVQWVYGAGAIAGMVNMIFAVVFGLI